VQLAFPTGRKETVIVGAAFYRSKRAKSIYMRYSLKEWKKWLWFKLTDCHCIYIMTIGVANEFRRLGIGKQFIDDLKCSTSEAYLR
jgi:ribosomal protein S18 acetylase RimI-like enzyme